MTGGRGDDPKSADRESRSGRPALRLAEPRSGRSRGLRSHLPEPAHLWVAFMPRGGRSWRSWPGPRRPWLDLARGGRPVWVTGTGRLPRLDDEALDDVLYLPPVAPEQEEERRSLARHHARRGTPVLMQHLAGEGAQTSASPGPEPASGIHTVFDLLATLSEGELDPLGRLPAGTSAVWPLLPGITDDPKLWSEGCRRLADAGVTAVQAVSPTLVPRDRRHLAEGRNEAVFHALFHRDPPPPRDFARVAWRHGLAPFLERPLPRVPLRGRENRRVAGLLFLTAELWHRLERPAARGQELFRAGRETDRTTLELAALAREGNLGVLTWLPSADRVFLEQALSGERPALLRELWDEYLDGEGRPEPATRSEKAEEPWGDRSSREKPSTEKPSTEERGCDESG